MSSNKRCILITMGDPSGIGPEVVVKALSDKDIAGSAHFQVIGDFFVVDKIKKALGSKIEFSLLDLANVPSRNFSFGRSDPSYGKASMDYIDKALSILNAGQADAVVTAPINKSSVRKAGFADFEGHTEYFAAKTDTKDYAMIFVGKKLKIALVTRHLALKDVSRSLSADSIYKAIRLTRDHLVSCFGMIDPRIGVAGLNPHAGEGGIFGDEEEAIIMPAIKKASAEFKNIYGPIPSDVIFYEALNARYDAIIAMYHDQALAPFKMLYFKDGVNVTLGLPFIRTSPDHGTAFDIAGKGIADPSSMKEALLLASRL